MIKVIRGQYEFQINPLEPFYRYKGSKAKSPPPIAPTPTPRQLDEEVKQKNMDKRRQRIAQAGRGGTILTQGQPLTGQASATILGRSTGG